MKSETKTNTSSAQVYVSGVGFCFYQASSATTHPASRSSLTRIPKSSAKAPAKTFHQNSARSSASKTPSQHALPAAVCSASSRPAPVSRSLSNSGSSRSLAEVWGQPPATDCHCCLSVLTPNCLQCRCLGSELTSHQKKSLHNYSSFVILKNVN